VAIFCLQTGLSPTGLRVDLSFTIAEENGQRRVSSVYAEVEAPGIPVELAVQAEQAAQRSILPNTLTKVPDLDIVVRTRPGQSEAA
jgi:hypothetical protein